MTAHADALSDILARHTARQEAMRNTRHKYSPNMRGTCAECGKGRWWHIERGYTR